MTRSAVPVLPALDGVVVTAAGVEAFDCPVCGCARDLVVPQDDESWTAPPPRGDHLESPDRACAVCGLALVVGTAAQQPAVDIPEARRAG